MTNSKPDPAGALRFTKKEISELLYLGQEEIKDRLRAFIASQQYWDFLLDLCEHGNRDLWTDKNQLAKHLSDWFSARAQEKGQGGLRILMDQYGFAICTDAAEILTGYYREEVDQLSENSEATKPADKSPQSKLQKNSELTAKRRLIVRHMMTSKTDFRNSAKVQALCQRLDTEGVPLPRWNKTPRNWAPKSWMEIFPDPKTPEYKRLFDSHTGLLAYDLHHGKTA